MNFESAFHDLVRSAVIVNHAYKMSKCNPNDLFFMHVRGKLYAKQLFGKSLGLDIRIKFPTDESSKLYISSVSLNEYTLKFD